MANDPRDPRRKKLQTPEELRSAVVTTDTDEPPSTKKESAAGWLAHADMAKAMIADLDALERTLRKSDPRRVMIYRGFRMSLGGFVEMFEAWEDPTIVFQQKERELQEFRLLRDVVLRIANLGAPSA